MPVFSIIVTAYNQEKCIIKAIESILSQSFLDYEILLIDDFSTDNTYSVLSDYEKKYENIHVYRHKENKGSHQARKTGVENANGNYILFLDGDDFLYTDTLKKLYYEVIQKETFDVCECSYMKLPEGKKQLPFDFDVSQERLLYYSQPGCATLVWNKLYLSTLIKTAFSEMENAYIRCGDDTYESICIAYYTKKFIQRDIIIINYNIGDGVSFKKNTFESNQKHADSLQATLKLLKQFLYQKNIKDWEQFYAKVENNLFNWFFSVCKNNTDEKDIEKSLLLLPKVFSLNLIEPYFAKLYKFYRLKRKIKNFIKKIVHKYN